ncbi:regulatory protein GntR HTH [Microbacterium sp. HM58-2]|nr:regulatory protein GntR HTH [Microbacterium sp. HM58-2]
MSPERFEAPRGPAEPLSETVFRALAQAIVSGEIPPQKRLNDDRIARQYGVSRTPVREAFRRLESIGFLEIYANRRTAVTSVTARTVRESLTYAGYQAGFAVHAGLPLLNADERAEAAQLAREAGRCVRSRAEASAARRRLFSYLSEHSGNPMHHAHMRDLEYAFERNLGGYFVPSELAAAAESDFEALAGAILRGDRALAEEIVRRLHGIDPD